MELQMGIYFNAHFIINSEKTASGQRNGSNGSIEFPFEEMHLFSFDSPLLKSAAAPQSLSSFRTTLGKQTKARPAKCPAIIQSISHASRSRPASSAELIYLFVCLACNCENILTIASSDPRPPVDEVIIQIICVSQRRRASLLQRMKERKPFGERSVGSMELSSFLGANN